MAKPNIGVTIIIKLLIKQLSAHTCVLKTGKTNYYYHPVCKRGPV
jgi:hypothetical protein